MNINIKYILKMYLPIVGILVSPILLMAQPIDPSDSAQGVPIDGGIGILIGAGATYAAKKLWKKGKTDTKK